MHVCSGQVSEVKLHHYPRVCGSEVLCLLSRSGWARFLRPVGTDHSVCALTDGEQHTDNPLCTSARTAQPLSPEADPLVQGEARGDESKGCRNDLEWQSRELAKLGADIKVKVQRCTKVAIFLLEPDSSAAPVPVTSLMNSERCRFQSRYLFFFPQVDWTPHQFIPTSKAHWSWCWLAKRIDWTGNLSQQW